MATVLSHSERARRYRSLQGKLQMMEELSRGLDRLSRDMARSGYPAGEVVTAADAGLAALAELRDGMKAALDAIPLVAQVVVRPGMPHGYTGASVSNTQVEGRLEVPDAFRHSVFPFGGLEKDDVVTITDARSPENNGAYTVLHTAHGAAVGQLISEPTFGSADPWSPSAGTIVISGGEAVFTASSALLDQGVGDMASAWMAEGRYEVKVELSEWTSGSFAVGTNAFPLFGVFEPDDAGVFTTMIQVGSGATALRITGFSATLKISSVTMRPWSGLALGQLFGAPGAFDDRLVVSLSER